MCYTHLMVCANYTNNNKKSDCEWREVMDLIADKWSMMILQTLCHKQLRYSEVHRRVEGISQKMLTSTLRQLERDGIVKRTVYPVIPPKVEYELTPLGYSVFDIIDALRGWSINHLQEVQAARYMYDSRNKLSQINPATTISSIS